MSKTAITSPELAPPVGPFSQAIEVGGFLYFSGQVGQDPATGKVVEGGIVAETERVFQNLSAVLKAAGKSFDDVVRAGVYLTSMSDFVALNGIYAKHFTQPFPARTTIAVAALPLGACVEIDLVVKARGDARRVDGARLCGASHGRHSLCACDETARTT
jgi:2-iminobutanoate/2-iminopropanoate deaminase